MGFFTGVILFLFAVALLSLCAKYPLLFVTFIIIVVWVIAVKYQESKEKEEHVKQSIERIRQKLEKISFKVDSEIYLRRNNSASGLVYAELIIDRYNHQIAICDFLNDDLKLIQFQQLINCEIIEDDEIIRSFTKRPDKKSKLVIGGMPDRDIKPIVNNLSIKIETSNLDNTVIWVPIITTPTHRENHEYKKAYNIASDTYCALVRLLK